MTSFISENVDFCNIKYLIFILLPRFADIAPPIDSP